MRGFTRPLKDCSYDMTILPFSFMVVDRSKAILQDLTMFEELDYHVEHTNICFVLFDVSESDFNLLKSLLIKHKVANVYLI